MTKAEAAVEIIMAVAEAIRELGEVPAGHLYARLCGKLELQEFTKVIDILKRAGVVEERNHVLTWIGPVLNTEKD